MKLVRTIALFFQEGTSDKVYNASIYDEGGGAFTVEVEWGRRGASLNKGKKAVKVSRAAADKAMDRLVREKMNKGYEEISNDKKPAAVAPPEGEGSGSRATGVRKRVGVGAQLLNAIDVDAALSLLDDAHHIAQQKLDGARVLVHVRKNGEKSLATNRSGQATSIAEAILEGLSDLPHGTIVDGEVVTTGGATTYILFDVLQIGDEDVRALGYLARWERLDEDLEPGLSGPIRVIECARTPKEKRSLHDRLAAARAEGVVFKRKDAPYTSGRPASGGTQLKHKFVKSADVVIVENAGNAYRMQVRDGKKWLDVGKVFSGTTNESRRLMDARLGDGERLVAEVRYLYATDDEQLFQPVFVRLRDDKDASECLRSQLTRTSRDVHEVDG
jgi:bifunctional non-homologous end joining protein LigD